MNRLHKSDDTHQAAVVQNARRRWFLQQCGIGLGSVALTSLMAGDGFAASPDNANPLAPKAPHFPAKIKNVILLFMGGGPSQFEMFDHKPMLAKLDGTLPPPDLLDGYRAAFINPNSKLLGPKFGFSKHGQSGAEISELLPHTASVADDLCIVRSMTTDAFNHAPAQLLMSTGSQQFGRPSMGSWLTYGLGSESENLPAYVVFNSGKKGPSAGAGNWNSGFLPTMHSGVEFRSSGDPVLYLSSPEGLPAGSQRSTLDAINRLNRQRLDVVGDPEIATRVNSYEMAFRMQSSAPEAMSLADEPQHMLDLYGAEPGKMSFANNCLLARRLVQRGVRFVQLFHESWDQHGGLTSGLKQNCLDTDQACGALVKDLKQQGLLDETLVIWGGEFGRTPMVQGGNDGRDHHPNSFTMWMAGGGLKKGLVYGSTDELGFNVAENPVHVHDLHATILQLLGFDHKRLTYRFQGRDYRLTDVHGNVVKDLLA
ncbi:hypothetical protein K227x_29790 [Rubripirellula lacrimiformis]|uniref:Sulfatase n=1 Tax=Rubripirellula lacrimiformis TaxID=1930273 RepID=A0A517NBR6_9BACT|nr:DUF1501 domain-containing protein [Rubripirellula lacrimiformis]QDT04587.1 hypothetical protein K227x_29790 [Rubripirellula lacrimiformis]